MQINRRQFSASVLATVSGVVAAPAVLAQQKFEMKLAYFVGDQHAMSRWLIKWSDKLEKESGGRITVKRFPGAQMGPVPAALRLRAHRAGRRRLVPARRHAGALPADRNHPAALSRGQRRDRHQGAERRGAARQISRRRASRREGAAAAHASARQRAHHQEADPYRRRHEGHAHPVLRRRRSAISSPRSAQRRSACRRPSRSSSCRRARSTAPSSTTAAPASPSRWAAC